MTDSYEFIGWNALYGDKFENPREEFKYNTDKDLLHYRLMIETGFMDDIFKSKETKERRLERVIAEQTERERIKWLL